MGSHCRRKRWIISELLEENNFQNNVWQEDVVGLQVGEGHHVGLMPIKDIYTAN